MNLASDYMLPAAEEAALRRAVGALGGDGPVILVVASWDYTWLLDNWIAHIEKLGIDRFLLVAMDKKLERRARDAGLTVVGWHFDGSSRDFWLRRAAIWEALARMDVAFIHSDIDAVWLEDPRPYLDAQNDYDLLFSEGTIYPEDIRRAWGFVLCTGFFWAKPSAGSRAFFSSLIARGDAMLQTDDQTIMNRLLCDLSTQWAAAGYDSYSLSHLGLKFTCYREMIAGQCAALDLRLGLLPHRLFPRLQADEPAALVRHVLQGERRADRVRVMRAAGCWMMDGRRGRLGTSAWRWRLPSSFWGFSARTYNQLEAPRRSTGR